MNRVQKGQPLRGNVTAEAWNAAMDAAADLASRRNTIGRDWLETFRQADIVRIRNDSGYARERFDVLGVEDVVITPSDNVDEFKSRPALAGVKPDIKKHVARFTILLEPVASGAIGMGVVAGVTVARVDVKDEGHWCAEIEDEGTDHLVSAGAGSAKILWKESGTGVKWAVVRLGHLELVRWGKAMSNWHNAAGNGSWVMVHPCRDKDGTDEDTAVEVKVYLPRSGKKEHPEGTEDPNVIGGAIIPFEYDTNGDAICVGTFLDGVIEKTVQMWIGDPANIGTERPGWADAGYGTRFPVGYASGDTDYGSIGATGGYKWHGQTENNHTSHDLEHDHNIPACLCVLDMGSIQYYIMPYFQGAPIWKTWLANWQNTTYPHPSHHDGPYGPSSHDTDNRPPWKVLFFIKRIDNSA